MESGLRRKDTTKGPPLRILSLDGGGVRGYSMLIILQELMYRTYVECEGKAPRRDQIPKPCDHFDLIAGTGTGGLIAIMLGRLRMDIETCKEVYIRMTRRVFETDKTIAGIPYRTTLFKASRLEDAIRQCVREHTVNEEEGNDGTGSPNPFLHSGGGAYGMGSTATLQRRLSRASVSTANTSMPTSPVSSRPGWGDPNAKLYDNRENRTKTAVTAVYKGTPKNGSSAMLRSYDSRREPPPEFNCTIWQAGRATSATGLAFKPIQIGQHIFLDEGAGKYNPSPQVLDEAVVNEWPGREVGVFVSIGTGKRPQASSNGGETAHEWWEDVFRDSLGNFAEARRRLIAKIEGCETTHQFMVKDHLVKRNVPRELYFRLNVEVGVGEFGMNEWSRLAEISTSTRMYLAKGEVQRMNYEAAVRLARIERAHRRLESREARMASEERRNRPVPALPDDHPDHPDHSDRPDRPERPDHPDDRQEQPRPNQWSTADNANVFELPAIELPPDEGSARRHVSGRPGTGQSSAAVSFVSHDDKFAVLPGEDSAARRPSAESSAPPLPPKTPIPYPVGSSENMAAGEGQVKMPIPPRSPDRPVSASVLGSRPYKLPYPDDGPPPVNRTRKPSYQ